MRQVLVAHGYHETVTFSFVQPRLGSPFVDEGFAGLMIDDERRKAEPMLRPAIAPSLLICRKANQDVGNADVRLFETASTWVRQNGAILERKRLGMLADAADPQQALPQVRGTIQELIERLGGHLPVQFDPAELPNYAAAMTVAIGGIHIGSLGLADQETLDLFDLQTQVVLAELDLESLLELYPPVRQVGNLPRFPGIERDLSVVVAEPVTWRQIESAVRQVNPPLMESLQFLVVYRGKPIEAGRKSMSFRMVFRDPQRTLRHDQVDPQVAAVVERLKAELQAELRA
jgi:phenylalanyl-tRNA synthetase beta chain